jgi:hypothetical protein
MVAWRSRAGRLHRLHRGVYAVGHAAPSRERRWIAAVLALAGRSAHRSTEGRARNVGTALSHRSAAALWGLSPPGNGPVEVSVPGGYEVVRLVYEQVFDEPGEVAAGLRSRLGE